MAGYIGARSRAPETTRASALNPGSLSGTLSTQRYGAAVKEQAIGLVRKLPVCEISVHGSIGGRWR